jgi:hypothetical protein
MNSFQSTVSSARNQRIFFFLALAVLAAGIVFLVVKFVGNGDSTSASPSAGFKPQLPTKNTPLQAKGARVTKYKELSPEVKTAIRRFVLGAVAGHNYADSWNVIAPSMRKGYTAQKWATAPAHPVIPFPVYHYATSKFTLAEATTKTIVVDLKMKPTPNSGQRETRFRVGLEPADGGKRWLVNYWMPLWTPPLADSSNNH